MNMSIRSFVLALALALAASAAFAQDTAPAAAGAPPAPSSTAPTGKAEQTLSAVTLQTAQGQVTIRSVMPDAGSAPPRPDFATLDTNHDGWISHDEARAYPPLANEFEFADANHDGKVSKAEYARWH